jgi:Spy/CpxP family protein refolding chaperone
MGVQDQDQRREVMASVQAEHERRLVEELGITRAQGTELRALLYRYREARMQIMGERAQIREDLVRHGEVGGSEADAQRILDRMRALRARELEMQRSEEEALLDILTPSQILQMQVLRDRFSEQIRQLERNRAGGRPREDGGEHSEGVSSR